MPMTTADCDKINTAIIRESGRISPEIHTKVVLSTPWVSMTPRAAWPDGMGLTQTSMMFERMLPADDNETWADVAPSDGASINQCLPPTEILKWGQTLSTWNLQKIAKQTEDFCIEDLRSAFELSKVLGNYTKGLTTVARWVWENRDRNEYIRNSMFKITEGAGNVFNLAATSWNAATPPTSRLTWGTLKQIRSLLVREGAGTEAMGVNGSGAPVYGLMTDENTQEWLLKDDPEARSDFRFAYEGDGMNSPLIKAPFMLDGFSYNGYKFMTDFFPARYEIVNGAYVRVPPFSSAAATTAGTKRNLNLSYIYATYQATPIHVPGVFTQRIPRPISNPGGRFKFDPVNYMGDFQWKNILDKICNPDGTIGFFRAVFASGSEPVHPEFGYVVMHLSCPARRDLKGSCYS